MNNLECLGYDAWFHTRLDPDKAAAHALARVISVHKDSYVVTKGHGDVFAELSGTLFFTAGSPLDLPTTGDWVYTDFHDEDSHAIVHGVVARKTLLKRKTAGKTVNFQLIAANIDVAFIIQSVDHDFNLQRLERYLVMVNESRITPVILLSKCDLLSQDQIEEIRRSISAIDPHISVVAFSNISGENIQTIQDTLVSGKTYCLLGSSGVGKTTLLNSVLGREQFATQSVRKKDSKGRHTTTSRELIQLESGALILDTPGMRELGNMSVDTGLGETFSDIEELASQCKFHNCSHTNEKGCAIVAALKEGVLTEQRYNNYVKIKKETAFNEMSYFDKRTKDKAFGKHVKAVKKIKNKQKAYR